MMLVTMQDVGKWRREFENGSTDVYHDDRTDGLVTSQTDVNAERVEKLILGKRPRLYTVLHDSNEELGAAVRG
jgi:hypothetical protein